MLVRNKLGMRKGQIQDLSVEVVRQMIADGRAELAFPDQYPAGFAGELHQQREQVPELQLVSTDLEEIPDPKRAAAPKGRRGLHGNG